MRLGADFAGRMKWTVLMAKKKEIELRIVDETEVNKYFQAAKSHDESDGLEGTYACFPTFIGITSIHLLFDSW